MNISHACGISAYYRGAPSVAYLKSINFIAPEFMSPFAHAVEWIIIVTLIPGIDTR